jgi:hypothetical protein
MKKLSLSFYKEKKLYREVRYHEIHNQAHTFDHCLGIDWRADLHSAVFGFKSYNIPSAGVSAFAFDITERICAPAVPLGISSAKINEFAAVAVVPVCLFD